MKFIDISTFFFAHEVDHFGYILANLSSLAGGREIEIIPCNLTPINGLISTGQWNETSKREKKGEKQTKLSKNAFT